VLESISKPLLRSITTLTGVEVHVLSDLSPGVQQAALEHIRGDGRTTVEFRYSGMRFIGCRFHSQRFGLLVAGPYLLDHEDGSRRPKISADTEHRLRMALESTSESLRQIFEYQRAQLELANQFELMSSAIIAISGELSLENVLNRIVDLARSVAGARYAALGVPGPDGDLVKFITSGLTPEQHDRIGELPRGRGLLGLLFTEKKSLRIRDISSHPESVGFPEHHPPMRSFLGVPIIAHGKVLGNLYLTEKRFAEEFTTEDEELVELLARHAAVAIENAQLYERLETQEERLRFVIDQLPEAVVLVEANPERITMANRQASLLLGWDLSAPISLDEFLTRNPRLGPDGEPLEREDRRPRRVSARGTPPSSRRPTSRAGAASTRTTPSGSGRTEFAGHRTARWLPPAQAPRSWYGTPRPDR
jgi:GAF domain-containing protein